MNFPEGSIWRKWDLHFHSPSSHDYKDMSVSDQEIIDGLVSAEISVVAITDHSLIDVERVQRLQKLGAGKVTVLPGIELRTNLGGSKSVHLIGIFSEACNLPDTWTKLSGRLQLTPSDIEKKGGHEKIYVNFDEAAKVIRELDGVVSVHAGTKSNSIETLKNYAVHMQAYKTDLMRYLVDVYEVGDGSDVKDYQNIVFPKVEVTRPLVICSDNHDIKNYSVKANCWIKGDPTFATFQQMISDPDRAWIGDTPPEVERLQKNPTKFIREITFKKVEGAYLKEEWFSGAVRLNPGLVAIIGKKGSGKTALAEAIGLLGDCELVNYFSFLNEEKFKHPKSNKARQFAATMSWCGGEPVSKSLNDDYDSTRRPRVSYIPQGYLEVICNELTSSSPGQFEFELKSVIFSHVAPAKRLEADSLDRLIEFRTQPMFARVQQLREELERINQRIVDLQLEGSVPNRQLVLNLKRSKEDELKAHDAIRPPEVKSPPEQTVEQAAISKQISDAVQEREKAKSALESARAHESNNNRLLAVQERLSTSLQNFRAQFDTYLGRIAADCEELGLNASALIQIQVDPKPLAARGRELREQANATQDTISKSSGLIETFTNQINALTVQLDAPLVQYQRSVQAMRDWAEQRSKIVGTESEKASLSGIEGRLKRLDSIPELLKQEAKSREALLKQIYGQLADIAAVFRELYASVQQFIETHPLAKQFKLSFDASITCTKLEEDFLRLINQHRKGSFIGAEEGAKLLGSLIRAADFSSVEGTLSFVRVLMDHLTTDKRAGYGHRVSIDDQLKKGVTTADLLNLVFGLKYLSPRYSLKWFGKELEQLSPGERGTLLLIFYLLIDKRDIPLIIDQPEENLDNETVSEILVPCLKEARKRRQVIIVTHNPNLAIVCDADQIIHSTIDKAKTYRVTYTSGAIENPIMNQFGVNVLEGTRPAFDHRDSKYHEAGSGPSARRIGGVNVAEEGASAGSETVD